MTNIPRPEYPRPQFRREEWRCLNGWWDFEVDEHDDGEVRGMLERPLRDRILVPFAPESPASGLALGGFLSTVWYRREIEIPPSWEGLEPWLVLQAVDYDATVWCNGVLVAHHVGGQTPLRANLSSVASPGGVASVVVRARDDPEAIQPRGKQSDRLVPYGSRCVRTTGIWQSVWLEPRPVAAITAARITPDLAGSRLLVELRLAGPRRGHELSVSCADENGHVAAVSIDCGSDLAPLAVLELPTLRRRPWSPEDPFCYALRFERRDEHGRIVDEVASYGGLRSVTVDGGAVLLNGKARFLRLVLDQGYWSESGLTAPSDAALRGDLIAARAAGFDGARVHQRVAEERYLYHADRLGMLLWGEFPDWGNRRDGPEQHHCGFTIAYAGEWLEALERDYSHPSIIAWCALNETEGRGAEALAALDAPTAALYQAARVADRTRPVLDVSGYHHRIPEADLWDCHDYEQDPQRFAAHYRALPALELDLEDSTDSPWPPPRPDQAIIVSEFGGASLIDDGREPVGYGSPLSDPEALVERFAQLCEPLLTNHWVAGYAYTQLCDTCQEHNGLLRADRSPKLALERFAEVQRRPAAIERRLAESAGHDRNGALPFDTPPANGQQP